MWSVAYCGRKLAKFCTWFVLAIFIIAVFFCLNLMFEVTAHSQTKIQPNRDINWPACNAGQVYSPNGNLCVNSGGGSAGNYPVLVVKDYPGATFMEQLQNCIVSVPASTGGVCDGRGYSGTLIVDEGLTIATQNLLVLLPCATIQIPAPLWISAGTRNVHLQGCSFQGGSSGSGGTGGTVLQFTTDSGPFIEVGDSTYAVDTKGFWMQDLQINLATSAPNVVGMRFYRAQEVRLDNVYIIGDNSTDQTGIFLDGTGNYTGGTFIDVVIQGTYTGWYLTGHLSGSASGDYANASTFIKTHVNCATPSGSPTAGTTGIYVAAGDGNTWTGGDVESCSTMFHLGGNAVNNTVVGLRNENSTIQYQADSGANYNYVATGGTFFTGELIDNGSRNSFWDAFHRTVNGINGDWYASQKDATVTNHLRLGTGAGNERGLLNEIQTDSGYRWIYGFSDATAGEQFYQIQDVLNNVYRLNVGQYNSGGSTNNQTVLNAAGTGAVVLNGSNNAGTGGVIFGSGGATETTVATIDGSGNAVFNGNLNVGGNTSFVNSPTVKNQADAEIDMTLWAGLTTAQKESFIYKDWSGTSRWYLENDAANNWHLNNATGGLDVIKAYDSANSGDLYLGTSNLSGAIRLNYVTGSSGVTNIYGGSSSALLAHFSNTSPTTQIPDIERTGIGGSYPPANQTGMGLVMADTSGYLYNSLITITGGNVRTSAGDSVTHTFTSPYGYVYCTATPTTSVGNVWIIQNGSASITIEYEISGPAEFNVICLGTQGSF